MLPVPAVPEPPAVVVVSRATHLAAALAALLADRARVTHVRWPPPPGDETLPAADVAADVIVVDLPASHHGRVVAALAGRDHGRTVLLLEPDAAADGLPADPRRLELRRPFPLAELAGVIAAAATAAQVGAAADPQVRPPEHDGRGAGFEAMAWPPARRARVDAAPTGRRRMGRGLHLRRRDRRAHGR
jgi:hypothetical protein